MSEIRDPKQAFAALEAVMLRQMLQSSGAFKAGDTPGGALRRDLFIETLADAVSKAGGLGVARMLERQLGDAAARTGAGDRALPMTVPSLGAHSLLRGGDPRAMVDAPGADAVDGIDGADPADAVGAVDDLEDPNSEAPLPEDPEAQSIDELQPQAQPQPRAAGDVTSPYGQRIHPITHKRKFHTGVDLRAAEGTPVPAAAGGVVREAGRRGGYGNAVEILHADGTSTLYAHASQLLVKKGQRVEAGEAVALVGQTGSATGPHLHFELRRNDHPVNPGTALPGRVAQALNRYGLCVEDSIAGTPSASRRGEER